MGAYLFSFIIDIMQKFQKSKMERDLNDPSKGEKVYVEIKCRRCNFSNQIYWDREEELKCISCNGPLYIDDRSSKV
jgi:ribosomal protein S27E